MKICISPGHGGKTPGAINGVNEKDINLKIGLRIGYHLKRHNVEVIYTRETDTTLELKERCDIANKNKCDYFIENHLNSFEDPLKNGTETWCYKRGDISETLAQYVQEELVHTLGLRNRGIKYSSDNNLYVIENTNMPAILPEICFLSNNNERDMIIQNNWQEAAAIAIAKGTLKMLGIGWQDELQQSNKHSIMGACESTAEQMIHFLLNNNPIPLINTDLFQFAQTFIDEGTTEGIRGDIAFCQSCKETGYFKYGNLVLPEQNNYAGIGATNNSSIGKSAWFNTPQEGIRAQIQHLKAYASKEPLKNACVDPRFNLVSRGIALSWEDLNGRWAVPGTTYGQDILTMFDKLKQTKVPEKPKEDYKALYEQTKVKLEAMTTDRDKLQNKINKIKECVL